MSPCRISWVVSEASSWAEYEHKWCFHSALLSALWIPPQALISMAAAFSLIPGLCSYPMHTHTHTPIHYGRIHSSTSYPICFFPHLFTPPYCSPPLAHSSSSFSVQRHICLWFILPFYSSPSLPVLSSLSHVLVLLCMIITPSSSLSFIFSCMAFFCFNLSLIGCQLVDVSPLSVAVLINQGWMVVIEMI